MPIPSPDSTLFDCFLVALGTLIVGVVDYVTGTDVHVLALYFVPLAYAGWRLGRTGAVLASLLSTLAWLAVLYAEGARHPPYVWIVNFVTQSRLPAVFSPRRVADPSAAQGAIPPSD